jgi:DNA-binding CsgD family transcriptional regulator
VIIVVECEMSRGAGLRAFADRMSVTVAPVRVHLQRVFEKTHTRRQAEVARLLPMIEAAIELRDSLP